MPNPTQQKLCRPHFPQNQTDPHFFSASTWPNSVCNLISTLLEDSCKTKLVHPPDLQILVEPGNLVPRNYSVWEKVLAWFQTQKPKFETLTHTRTQLAPNSALWKLSLKSQRYILPEFFLSDNFKYLLIKLQSEKFFSIYGWVCYHICFFQSNTSFSTLWISVKVKTFFQIF